MRGMTPRLSMLFSFWAYPLLSGVFVVSGLLWEPERSVSDCPVLIAYGVLLWTLIEYLMHRFIFHPHHRIDSLQRLGDSLHGVHHRRPRDPSQILASASTSIPPSVLILGLLWLATGSPLSSAGVMTGVWAGFLYYEWVHYRIHTTNAEGILAWHRKRHFHHHFVDELACFGLTSPLWDIVFGTIRR
jgi:dihydroceramide fatty acyl 2-hydroxylase